MVCSLSEFLRYRPTNNPLEFFILNNIISMNSNPIFATYNTPYGAYPFDLIKEEHYKEAFELAIAEKYTEINAIISSPEPPTFNNTILALELCGRKLELVSGIFFNLLHSHSSDTLMAISEEIMPSLSELSTYILLSAPLFERISSVYERRGEFDLSDEEHRLLINCYEGFAENGALLPEEGKARLRVLSQELSQTSLNFGQNNLKDQKRFKLHLTQEDDVRGLPESTLTLARESAQREGYNEGWLFNLSAPSYFPFMQHCASSHWREVMYWAKAKVGGAGDEYDNRTHIRTLVNGRLEEAQLLGYPTFAHYALHKRMAKSPSKVYELLDQLLEGYKPIAIREVKQIENFAKETIGSDYQLKPWDWSYWAEQYKQKYYDLDDEMLRPYFELKRVSEAVFSLATTLYGIRFQERKDIPVYHPDVRVYEVIDEDESYLGLLYTDFYPRDSKQSGAWMSSLQDQYQEADGSDHRPHILLVMNFTPPSASGYSLLTIGEVNTFLHEFGHALHGMLSKCRFSSLSGTSVARDFVELPSQIMENWMSEPVWLKGFARHYLTNEELPNELIERMQRAKHYLVGYAACRQLSFGYLDMAWHSIESPLDEETDVVEFEDTAWKKAIVIPPKEGHRYAMSSSFGHIFSGGYSAGYYGYKWAEVLDADAFAEFKKGGIFSRDVAARFRTHILSQGDKKEPMDLYKAFKGDEPSINALLVRDGIVSQES